MHMQDLIQSSQIRNPVLDPYSRYIFLTAVVVNILTDGCFSKGHPLKSLVSIDTLDDSAEKRVNILPFPVPGSELFHLLCITYADDQRHLGESS